MARFVLSAPGPRPPFYRVAEHLWGVGCDFDSDGNSPHRDATDWTELTVILRLDDGRNSEERVDIDPESAPGELALSIRSDGADLARRAAEFLKSTSGGDLSGG